MNIKYWCILKQNDFLNDEKIWSYQLGVGIHADVGANPVGAEMSGRRNPWVNPVGARFYFIYD